MRGMRRGVQRDNYILLMRKAPLAVLVALGGVGDADARGGGELDACAARTSPLQARNYVKQHITF